MEGRARLEWRGRDLLGNEEELALQRSGEKSILARGNYKCKGPEVGLAQ